MKRIALLAVFLAAPVAASAAQPTQPPERQIDALFAPWNRPDVPGAVVAVIRDGKVVLTKRYGMADIERGVPMSPSAAFFIGSMSKQFTAFAIHLLFARATDARFSFDPPGKDGIVAGGVLHWGQQDVPAMRTARPMPSAAELQRLEGDFYSDELHVLYSIAGRDGDLVLTYPGGTVTLGFNGERDYATGFGTIKYQCSADGCTGFTISTERARNVQFRRVALTGSR